MASLVEVIVGTYEEFILGYKVENIREENDVQLKQSFATRSHTGSIRCIAVKNHYVASGGADDRIFLYDMKTRKEIQVFHHHEGTVNALDFTPDASHLLTGSDDGKMCAVRLGTWHVEGSWKKAHSGSAVTHISCHPSGKLALTLGTDQTLRTWNLIKGRLAYTTNLKTRTELGRNPECLAWSPDGDHFTITGLRILEIWSVKTAGVVKDYKCESKPICVCWLDATRVAVGFENGKLWILDFKSNQEPTTNEAHKQRVKAISHVNDIMATASSSGEITLWTVKKKTIVKLASINSGCRPTCIALLDLTQFGDDYVLKQENEGSDEETQNKLEMDTRSHIQSVGNVIVEVEGEDAESENDVSIETKPISESKKKLGKEKKRKHKKHTEESDEVVEKKHKKKKKKKDVQGENDSSDEISPKVVVSKKKRKSNQSDEDDELGDANDAETKQKKKKSKHKKHY